MFRSKRRLDIARKACYQSGIIVRTADFDYHLPPELIAQTPADERDRSRLLVLKRETGACEHRSFCDITGYLEAGDVLVLNNSRVIPARLRGVKFGSGGQVELLLLRQNGVNDWWAMMRPGKRIRPGSEITLLDATGNPTAIRAVAVEKNSEGHGRFRFEGVGNILDALDSIGEIPLPPYISRAAGADAKDDARRYQTVYAQPPGSVAAPTAGLHFTEAIFDALRQKGVEVRFVTLHVGLGTFSPVKAERVADHTMHEEEFELGAETVQAIEEARQMGRRVVAVGTTTVRVLESVAAKNNGRLAPVCDRTRIFIHPPYRFRVVDALVTNFHLPQSTLLMLVSAFAAPGETRGREMILASYAEAIRERYRFFSYGDAMLIC